MFFCQKIIFTQNTRNTQNFASHGLQSVRYIKLFYIQQKRDITFVSYVCPPTRALQMGELEIPMRKVVGDALEERRGSTREGAGGAVAVGHVIKVVVADVEAAFGA